jgi:hypothetical protein
MRPLVEQAGLAGRAGVVAFLWRLAAAGRRGVDRSAAVSHGGGTDLDIAYPHPADLLVRYVEAVNQRLGWVDAPSMSFVWQARRLQT